MKGKLPNLSIALIKANTRYFCEQGFEPRETLSQATGWLEGADDPEIQEVLPQASLCLSCKAVRRRMPKVGFKEAVEHGAMAGLPRLRQPATLSAVFHSRAVMQ